MGYCFWIKVLKALKEISVKASASGSSMCCGREGIRMVVVGVITLIISG